MGIQEVVLIGLWCCHSVKQRFCSLALYSYCIVHNCVLLCVSVSLCIDGSSSTGLSTQTSTSLYLVCVMDIVLSPNGLQRLIINAVREIECVSQQSSYPANCSASILGAWAQNGCRYSQDVNYICL